MSTYHHNLLKNQGLGPVFASLQEDQFNLEARISYNEQYKKNATTEIHRKAPSTLEKNNKGEMLIHLVALGNYDAEALNDILYFGHKSDVNAIVKVGTQIFTPMHYAVQSGSISKVNLLVNKGASVNVKKLMNYALSTEMKSHLSSTEFKELVSEKSADAAKMVEDAKGKKYKATMGKSTSTQLKTTQRTITQYTAPNLVVNAPIAPLAPRQPRQASMDRFMGPPATQLQASERTAEQLIIDSGKRNFEIAIRRSLEDLRASEHTSSQSSSISSSSSDPRSRASSLSSEGHTDNESISLENIHPNSQNTLSPERKKKTNSEHRTPKFVKATTTKSITSYFPPSVGSSGSNASISGGSVISESLLDPTPSAPPAISGGTFTTSIARRRSPINGSLADRLCLGSTSPSTLANRSFGTDRTNRQSLSDRLYELESQHPNPENPNTPRASLMTARDRLTLEQNAETIGWVERHNNRSSSNSQKRSHHLR